MPQKQELSDKRFGRLVVLKEHSKSAYRKVLWLCKCDCGTETIVFGDALRFGRTKSCGCLRRDKRLLPGDSGSFNQLYTQYRVNSKNRKHEFALSTEEFREISTKTCAYCGSLPQPYYSHSRKNPVEPYICNGIDRVDNNTGYVKDSCVACCAVCNYMKRSLKKSDFIAQSKKIAAHRG